METPITHAEFNDRIDKLERGLRDLMRDYGRAIAREVVLENTAALQAQLDKRFADIEGKVAAHDRYISGRRKVEAAAVQVATSLIKIPAGVIGGKAAAAVIAATVAALGGLVAKLLSLLGSL